MKRMESWEKSRLSTLNSQLLSTNSCLYEEDNLILADADGRPRAFADSPSIYGGVVWRIETYGGGCARNLSCVYYDKCGTRV